MPKLGLLLFLLAWAVIFVLPAEAKRGCPDHLRDIKRLYAARDPGLLTANILEPGCTPRELYQAAYYQGFGFYFVGRFKDALANFQLARGLAGPWDEQILQYIWTIQGKLGDEAAQARTLEEFRQDFPKSRQLVEMETAERKAVKTSFDGLATVGLGWLDGERSYQGPRSQGVVGGSFTQSRGGHGFSEYANLAGVASLLGRRHQLGVEAGALYRGPWLSAQAEVGRIRTLYRSAFSDSGLPKAEWAWTGSLGHAFHRGGGWTWTAGLDHFVLGETFSSVGLTWEMEKRAGLRTHALDLTAELQDLNAQGACVAIDQSSERCESLRYAAFEVGWEEGRTAGAHQLGAEVQARWEEGLSSPSWRGLVTGGFVHGFWLSPSLKLANVLDLGGEWWDKGNFERVVIVKSNLSFVF